MFWLTVLSDDVQAGLSIKDGNHCMDPKHQRCSILEPAQRPGFYVQTIIRPERLESNSSSRKTESFHVFRNAGASIIVPESATGDRR